MATDIKKATTIAGGVIGSSFTLLFAMGGMDVKNYNRSEDGEEKAKKLIDNYLKAMVKGQMIKEDDVEDIKARISFTIDLEEAISYGDYIQESLPENYEVKQEFVENFEKYGDDKKIMGSSTSGLLISKIAEKAERPERIVGAHPFNPPHLMPLIEIAMGDKSDDDIVKDVKEMFEKLGKKPIVLKKESPGFIANRFQALITREIINLVDNEVASVEDIEKALTFGPGIRWGVMGQCQNFELGGGDKGLGGLLDHLGDSMQSWLEDTATWTEIPKDGADKVVEGVKKAIENRPEEKGNTHEKLSEYRDGMVMEILKLHENYEV